MEASTTPIETPTTSKCFHELPFCLLPSTPWKLSSTSMEIRGSLHLFSTTSMETSIYLHEKLRQCGGPGRFTATRRETIWRDRCTNHALRDEAMWSLRERLKRPPSPSRVRGGLRLTLSSLGSICHAFPNTAANNMLRSTAKVSCMEERSSTQPCRVTAAPLLWVVIVGIAEVSSSTVLVG